MINPYMEEAKELRKAIDTFAEDQTDEALLDNKVAFPLWRSGVPVTRKQILRFNDDLYRVNQDHTTQDDWAPNITPALYTKISLEKYPEWVQPTGAHDAYNKGDKVSDEEKHWISEIDGNVWKPGTVAGVWREIE